MRWLLVKSEQKQKAKDAVEDVRPRLTDLANRLGASHDVYYTAGWFSFVSSDQKVIDRLHGWMKKDRAFLESFVATGGFTTNPEKLKDLSKLASAALIEAVAARRAIENFVFGGRRWTRRSLYYVWSKLKDAWDKDHTAANGEPPRAP